MNKELMAEAVKLKLEGQTELPLLFSIMAKNDFEHVSNIHFKRGILHIWKVYAGWVASFEKWGKLEKPHKYFKNLYEVINYYPV